LSKDFSLLEPESPNADAEKDDHLAIFWLEVLEGTSQKAESSRQMAAVRWQKGM
jgi:hypothetical protein